MVKHDCGKRSPGCPKSGNTYHKCKKTIELSYEDDQRVRQGGRINGPLYTDFCKGHVCESCNRRFS